MPSDLSSSNLLAIILPPRNLLMFVQKSTQHVPDCSGLWGISDFSAVQPFRFKLGLSGYSYDTLAACKLSHSCSQMHMRASHLQSVQRGLIRLLTAVLRELQLTTILSHGSIQSWKVCIWSPAAHATSPALLRFARTTEDKQCASKKY